MKQVACNMFHEVEGSLNFMKHIQTCFMQCFYLSYTMKQNMKESFIVYDSYLQKLTDWIYVV